MIVETLAVGQLGTNCYIVVDEDTKKAVVIDPGGDAKIILNAVKRLGADVQYIVDTHGHFDHTLANEEVRQATGAKLGINELDVPLIEASANEMAAWLRIKVTPSKPDFFLNEGDELKVGTITFKVMHTPGHSLGHITLVTDGKAFVGDVLFQQGIGRTDFPGGSYEVLMKSIRERLLPLGDDTIVYPGHGPVTTIGQERRWNPWLNMQ